MSPNDGAPFLEIDHIAKSFGEVQVLHDLALTLIEGEILALLGLSGSGKTTALRLLAGFETPDRGRIVVAGEDVTALRPAQRGFGMVFQHYALFPHMTVEENIAFGLEAQGWEPQRRQQRIATVLQLVDLAAYGKRRVSEISGGQQQRVALARALAPEPRVLLLDEPLSNLDPSLREKTRHELRAAVKEIGITTVLVTHEQEEAFHVGDRVAVLHDGRLQQMGLPQDLYRRPQRRFVATFVGRASCVLGTVETMADITDEQSPERCIDVALTPHCVWPGHASGEIAAEMALGERVELVIRPESLTLSDDRSKTTEGATEASRGTLRGTVVARQFTGPLSYCTVRVAEVGDLEVLVDTVLPAVDTVVTLELRPQALPARVFRPGHDS